MAKKKGSGTKTMPMRVLEEKGIEYRTRVQSRKEHTAEGVADDLGVPVAQVLKAMLVERGLDQMGSSYLLAVIPGDRRLSLKKLASELGEKNLRLASERDVTRVTGYRVGSVSVVGFRREDVPALIDRNVLELGEVIISAGRPDIALSLQASSLLDAIENSKVGDYCED
jgi:Cys-tRNA(Pro) deacylase